MGAQPAHPHADALDRARRRGRDQDATRTSASRSSRGKLCLRTSNNEYNQSFVADRIAKHGAADTEELLRSWMANQPQILGSDVDVLEAIAAGRCDVGLTNHYYLGRILKEKPDFPVAPAWPDQDGAGAHTNLSGVGLVKGSKHRADAVSLMEYLTSPPAQEEIVANSELAANPDVPPPEHIREWADVKRDPIDVERAGQAAAERDRADAEGRVEVAAGRRRPRGAGAGWPPGWAVASALVALRGGGSAGRAAALVRHRARARSGTSPTRCSPRRCARASCWRVGVGAGTLALGGSLAALVSFYDFPGRRWLDWALVLPLAMPAYVLVFVLLGQYDEASPLQSALRALLGDGFQLPQVRSTVGTITVLTLVLYPYVYMLGRGAFLEQSRDTMEAARTLGIEPRARRRAGGAAAGAPGAGGRRRAGGDGGAGRLRRGQPPQLPRDDRRDLPRLVRRLRPGGGAPARDDPAVADARADRARAAAARPGPLPRGARARRGGRAAAAARRRARRSRPRCRRCCWCSCSSGRWSSSSSWAAGTVGEGAALGDLAAATRSRA